MVLIKYPCSDKPIIIPQGGENQSDLIINRTDSIYRDVLEATTSIRLQAMQGEMFHNVEQWNQVCVVSSREIGKTTGCRGLAYAFSLVNPNSLIGIISTGDTHSVEILNGIKDLYRDSYLEIEFEKDTEHQFKLAQYGSRIISMATNAPTLRGYPF